MVKYVAFLRGINVGGNKSVPMAKAKLIFEELGFTDVRTVLASGNIIFDAKIEDPVKLTKKITAKLEDTFSFSIPVILREANVLMKIIQSDPFKDITVTKDTRLYLTFLSEEKKTKLTIPYQNADGAFRILNIDDKIIFSVLDVSKTGTPDAMAILERDYGKNITTRNWNTIKKITDK